MEASSGFLLGVDYSEQHDPRAVRIATDNSGALYDLANCQIPPASCVTKLSADGKTMLWQNTLAFKANTMAVDPNGGVYVIPASQPWDTSIFVAKPGASGTGVAWKTPVGFTPPPSSATQQVFLAADSQGRAYAAGLSAANVTDVVRLKAEGSAIDYTTQIPGTPAALAVGASAAHQRPAGSGSGILGDLHGLWLHPVRRNVCGTRAVHGGGGEPDQLPACRRLLGRG